MASERFLVSWNNFHKNMNSGVNSLLENEDFVDVTLAIEGRYLKAHKMVLSVCSSYFQELFKTSPCKHPIVFMKDVSYSAMSDLLQFMYKGEVQVDEENFNAFIKTAESLQIKGLSNYGCVASECGTESQQKKTSNSEVPTTDNSTSQERQHTSPIRSPKRLRLDDSIHDEIVKTEETLEESTATTSFSSELISLKTEPYDEEESSVGIADDDSNIFEDEARPIETEDDWIKENTNVDENDDFWMMQGAEEVDTKDTNLTGEGSFRSENEDSVGPAIPEKSKERYENALASFEQWCNENNVKEIEENALINYFKAKSTNYKSSSLRTIYSMLRIMLSIKRNIDISKYTNVHTYLRKISEGHKTKKSKILKKEHFEKFLSEATDDIFLMKKVAMIIGVAGACRREELTHLRIENVVDEGSCFRIHISDENNRITRTFVVTAGNIKNVNLIEVIRKYINLRPPKTNHQRFFICYRLGKCTKQPVGVHTLGAVPKNIAQFLGLTNPEEYTGHCFRRTSKLFKSAPELRSFP